MDADPETGCVSQTRSHFEHAQEAENLVSRLTTNDAPSAFQRLCEILDMYQEQSHLLDPFLEKLIDPVVAELRERIRAQGNQLDVHILFQYMYMLTKTRGYKTIVKFMSHDVTDLEPVFEFLCHMDRTSSPWETRYICFIWLSLICMIPFDLKKIDSSSASQDSLVTRMLTVCKQHLKSTGKERDGASLLVAKLLSRRDLCSEHLIPYIEWCKERLGQDIDVFETAGILASLCATYQYASRDILLPTLDDGILPILEMPFFEKYEKNTLIRQLRMKLAQRVGLCYLRPKVAAWRYQRGNRSLKENLAAAVGTMSDESRVQGYVTKQETAHDNDEEQEEEEEDISENMEILIEMLLNGLRDKDTVVRWSAAKGIGRITQRLPKDFAEDVIGSLLELFKENTLTDAATGKMDLSAVSDSTWHGVSLAIAELARRGLLLPHRLSETIPWIIMGLKFDLKRGSHSIGAHVRDAACYVCWSFARAYAPHIISPFVNDIAKNLVVVSVFDREINVRRASSAAFQENVGRQGIFPRGIDIIQLADYFTLGNRNNAFLNVSVEIARFDEYRHDLIDHSVTRTIKHWDKNMRLVACKTLYEMVPLEPQYFLNTVLPQLIPLAVSKDLPTSHGSMLAIAEICLKLGEIENIKEDNALFKEIAGIVGRLPPKSLTTFGSEHIREAGCRLVECLSLIRLPADDESLSCWKKLVYSSLERKEENVQEYAVAAFRAISATYGISEQEKTICLDKIATAGQMYGRRGYALALGTVSYRSEKKVWLPEIIDKMCAATRVQQEQQANDAEAKRNAVVGLREIIVGLDQEFKACVTHSDYEKILGTLLECLADYSTDQRGDVGSWVRAASMETLQQLLPLVARLDKELEPIYLTRADVTRVFSGLLKQSVERIDRVRDCAGAVLVDLLYAVDSENNPLIDVTGRDILATYINRDLPWSSPSDLYPSIINILMIPEYRFDLLTGLVTSAGGLTESLVRHSSSCLVEYMDKLPNDTSDNNAVSLKILVGDLLRIFSEYEKQDRIVVPLLDVVGLLYESGTLQKLQDESSHLKMLTSTRKEVFKSKNVRKLLSAIKVLIGLASLQQNQVRTRALQQLLSYLVHAFPRIRMEVADQLYSYLTVMDDDQVTEGTMEAIEIITGTDWAESLQVVKQARDQLYPLLDIPQPILKTK
ncbi:hypothetical protein VTP01DRAFT_10245 [Rhizomucor pusillus]|uniref:uncharacterized protein n=1 Tax=Rhizomucor pusillus TaxID=4840 RepID=UPI003744450E